jgi:hypothetical protein
MEWTQSDTLALAAPNCTLCLGTGICSLKRGQAHACKCVYRSIFRACYARFRYCATKEKSLSRVSLEHCSRGGRRIWGRKDEEYVADFTLVSRRALTTEEYNLFKYHFLLGADWRLCCRRLNLDRGNYFHAVYRIEQKLGQVFRELQPYALFPLDEYFNGTVRNECRPEPEARTPTVLPLRRVPLPDWILPRAA